MLYIQISCRCKWSSDNFELDEERNYRVVLNYEDMGNNKNIDIELLRKLVKPLKKYYANILSEKIIK
jgi:hypothetical protein